MMEGENQFLHLFPWGTSPPQKSKNNLKMNNNQSMLFMQDHIYTTDDSWDAKQD